MKKGQNLIEFVVIFPLIIMVLFGILEFGFFWKTVLHVQALALRMASNAATQVVTEKQTSTDESSDDFNAGVKKAKEILEDEYSNLGVTQNLNFKRNSLGAVYGTEPYALYQYDSEEKNENGDPIMTFYVDYRDEFNQGVVVQVVYNYTTILMGATFTLPNGNEIVIIPKNIPISSTRIQQYENY